MGKRNIHILIEKFFENDLSPEIQKKFHAWLLDRNFQEEKEKAMVTLWEEKSAVANDTDPSNIYAQQLFSLGRAGDCLIAISTSGNAENCVRAAMIAKLTGMKTIALTGEKGGRLKEIAEVTISVPEH